MIATSKKPDRGGEPEGADENRDVERVLSKLFEENKLARPILRTNLRQALDIFFPNFANSEVAKLGGKSTKTRESTAADMGGLLKVIMQEK